MLNCDRGDAAVFKPKYSKNRKFLLTGGEPRPRFSLYVCLGGPVRVLNPRACQCFSLAARARGRFDLFGICESRQRHVRRLSPNGRRAFPSGTTRWLGRQVAASQCSLRLPWGTVPRLSLGASSAESASAIDIASRHLLFHRVGSNAGAGPFGTANRSISASQSRLPAAS